jgi:hypothetical protein
MAAVSDRNRAFGGGGKSRFLAGFNPFHQDRISGVYEGREKPPKGGIEPGRRHAKSLDGSGKKAILKSYII